MICNGYQKCDEVGEGVQLLYWIEMSSVNIQCLSWVSGAGRYAARAVLFRS